MAAKSREVKYPFDVVGFIKDNKELVQKYLKKNTLTLEVEDFEVPKDFYYKNNPNLIRVGSDFEYSTLQKLEYVKCMKNCKYFTKKYVKIVSIDAGIINFNLYKYQEELLDLYQKKRFTLSMQGRQTGKTQTTAAFITWYVIFTPSKTVALLANKAAQAREILSRIQMSFEMMPKFLQQPVKTYNKGSMKLGNLSEVFCAASSSSSIRGRSISLLYIDEAAFLPNDMEFYESTYPTISSGLESRVIISSTPNGERGLFYKLWTESKEGINQFARMEVSWDKVPWRTKEWAAEQVSNTSQEQFDQEHGLKFRGSQNSLLAGHVLELLPIFQPVVYGDLRVFEEPVKGKEYFITVDCSRGVGGDYSAFIVFDISEMPYKVAAIYKNNRIAPTIYPQVIRSIADKYNKAYVLVEINDIGEQVASILYQDLEYENVLLCYSDKGTQRIGFVGDARLGVRTTTAVKSVGCSTVKTMVETGKLIPKDQELIAEFGNFIPKGKSYEAAPGSHDDLVMCCVLFAWATVQQYFIDITDKDIKKNLQDTMLAHYMEDMLPFGFIDDGMGDIMSRSNALSDF